MDSTEIKYEFGCDGSLQCGSCLSMGRKLVPLGQYTNVFMKLTADLLLPVIQPVNICWECISLLRKVLLFQQKVEKASELLVNNQNYIYGPLSSLASVTLNDTHHIIYLNEGIINKCSSPVKHNKMITKNSPKDKENHERSKADHNNVNVKKLKLDNESTRKIEDLSDMKLDTNAIPESNSGNQTNIQNTDLYIRKEDGANFEPLDTPITIQNDNNNVNYDDNNKVKINKQYNLKIVNVEKENILVENDNFENDFNYETPINETFEVKRESKSKKPLSRWAIKRAAHNKKPKFKIVSTNFDEAFTKIQISNAELAECMAKERDSEYYKSKRFKCESCILGFVDEKESLKHSNIHLSYQPISYTCDICKIKMSNKRHLSDHIRQHYKGYKCNPCQYICRNKETRVWHFQNCHKKVFQCLKCDVKCSNRRDFFKHYKDWHEKYICDHCGVGFKMRYCIKDHIRKRHSPFSCVPCNKTFARYNGLWLHNKLEHSPPAPTAYCVECDTQYKDVYRYKWHLCNSVRHSPKKKVSIPCPECDKTFTKKVYMKDHHYLVHLKLFRFRCEQCDKNFIRNAELVKHRRRKHEGILPPRNKICYLCGRGFTTNKILRNHVRTHAIHDITDEVKKSTVS